MGDGRVVGGYVKLEKWIDEEGRKIERIGEKEGEGMKKERGRNTVGMWDREIGRGGGKERVGT